MASTNGSEPILVPLPAEPQGQYETPPTVEAPTPYIIPISAPAEPIVIPVPFDQPANPDPPARNLVLCIDGSGNHYGPSDSNTNVVKFFRILVEQTGAQVCYYQPGIGAGEANGVNSLGVAIQKRVDFAIGTHLEVQVTDAYKWLMNAYQDGDKIYMFGFSRGSYICRALAGMLQRVGLLGAGNFHNVPFAYRIFSKPRTPANDHIAHGFKTTFSRSVHVEFIGVWDTVSSVGLLVPQTLPFTSGNTHIKKFRHAVSIDERRVRFQDNLWSGSIAEEEQVNEHDGHVSVQGRHSTVETDILEVWFAGTHSDVGGGWGDDASPSPAAQGPCTMSVLPLRWMAREAQASGVLLDPESLASLLPSPMCTQDPYSACSTLHNTLPWGSIWWVLEALPALLATRRSTDAKAVYGWGIHWGRARRIPEGAKVHWSVQVRSDRMGYVPAGGWPERFDWVD
ncbi:hypothetical protein DACRYDRAFT_47476 [Dacryopinax primogenitus]|uniref:T6SS Phospholipase effector Tle1-like catalytic domain-containing protein n=1 Tax=Dacryopinax primogenitus (strain DJM 731) TaxID=1858805 RepID=M5G7E7_DACPD|nr:uncharacterized protein DACRYDRAFT_47476 [Dacryopinax primogenitus]EJU04654.1 hypothetical protein DACRYDRAFT_47476 [Dacryopinax primogenitus]